MLCTIDACVDSLYVALIVMSACCPMVPFLHSLASHGKTRQAIVLSPPSPKQQQHDAASSILRCKRWILHNELLMMPKHFFVHFYIVGLAAFCGIMLMIHQEHDEIGHQDSSTFGTGRWRRHRSTFIQLLMLLHFVRRIYECRHVHRWKPNSRMHVAGYAVGMLHYLLLPFVFVITTSTGHHPSQSSGDEGSNSRCRINCIFDDTEPYHQTALQSSLVVDVVGATAFLYFQYQQYRHHRILATHRLRNSRSSNQRESNMTVKVKNAGIYTASASNTVTKYTVPDAGWFSMVCCPHYAAEVMIYVALAILLHNENTNQRPRPWLLLTWVTVNLVVSSRSNLAWYQAHCPGFRGKCAIFPGIL